MTENTDRTVKFTIGQLIAIINYRSGTTQLVKVTGVTDGGNYRAGNVIITQDGYVRGQGKHAVARAPLVKDIQKWLKISLHVLQHKVQNAAASPEFVVGLIELLQKQDEYKNDLTLIDMAEVSQHILAGMAGFTPTTPPAHTQET